MAREVVLFESLFKSNKWTWLFGWMFHAALLLVLLRHLRYFQSRCGRRSCWVQPFGIYAGFAMVAGLAGLWARRLLVDRVRYISTPSDHLKLALLLAIALHRPGHALRRAHRHRRREGLHARPDAVRPAAAAGRSGAARASERWSRC